MAATHDSNRCVFGARQLERKRGNHVRSPCLEQVLRHIEHLRRRCLDYSQIPAHRNSWVFSKMWRRRLDRRCPIARRRCLPSKWAPWVEEVRPRIKLQVGPPVVAAVPLLRHRRIQVRRRRLGHRRRGPRWLIPPEARKCSSHGKGRSRLLAEKRHGQYVKGPRWEGTACC